MAFLSVFNCSHCRRERREVAVPSLVCGECRAIIEKANEDAHMAKLAAAPVEERVRRIELALYRLDLEQRLKVLEAGEARYG